MYGVSKAVKNDCWCSTNKNGVLLESNAPPGKKLEKNLWGPRPPPTPPLLGVHRIKKKIAVNLGYMLLVP